MLSEIDEVKACVLKLNSSFKEFDTAPQNIIESLGDDPATFVSEYDKCANIETEYVAT